MVHELSRLMAEVRAVGDGLMARVVTLEEHRTRVEQLEAQGLAREWLWRPRTWRPSWRPTTSWTQSSTPARASSPDSPTPSGSSTRPASAPGRHCGQPSMPRQPFRYCRDHDRELRQQGGEAAGEAL
jgi:hypothetical protein